MRPIHLLYLLFLLLIIYQNRTLAQAEEFQNTPADLPQFYFDALNYSSNKTDTSRMDVFIEIPYRGLHFISDAGVFHANYELTISIYDSEETLVEEKNWEETAQTTDYDESVSLSALNLSTRSFYLLPVAYNIVVQLQEINIKRGTRLEKKMHLQNYSNSKFALSDVMLIKSIGNEGGKKIINPNLSGNVGDVSQEFQLFFEIYNNCKADSAVIKIFVRDARGELIQSDSLKQALGDSKNECFVKVSTLHLAVGEYFLEVHSFPTGAQIEVQSDKNPVIAMKRFNMYWKNVPLSLIDLDQAIDQLQYIADKDRIEEMKNAPLAKKKELFREFWQQRDPTPGTEQNELMNEYYARVEYANANYRHYAAGWKTDRGMVYIIFGPPSNVERHAFEANSKPYEIWSYYEMNREFVFVDETGFGDYRLQNPPPDIWQIRPR